MQKPVSQHSGLLAAIFSQFEGTHGTDWHFPVEQGGISVTAFEESPTYCKDRAVEARELAYQARNPGLRADWLEVAHQWEEKARRAENRIKSRQF